MLSAFVADSTICLAHDQQVHREMETVQRFGTLSGVHVQPAKSKLIFLNKAISVPQYGGLSVFQASDIAQYLGYKVGTG